MHRNSEVWDIHSHHGPIREFHSDYYIKIYVILGCGKTTLLNFLSGRMVCDNLTMTGLMKINGVSVENIDVVSNQIAYVMQDDILLATFTPRGFSYLIK